MSTKLNRVIRQRRGLTLIEAAMALVVMLVVIAGAMLMYQSANNNWKTSDAASQIGSVAQAIRSQYAGQSSYATLAAGQLVNQLPRKMVNGAGLVNAFNGPITVQAATLAPGTNNVFEISFGNIPQDACVKLAAGDYGRALTAITINTAATALPVTATLANTRCNAAQNTIVWQMY